MSVLKVCVGGGEDVESRLWVGNCGKETSGSLACMLKNHFIVSV